MFLPLADLFEKVQRCYKRELAAYNINKLCS